MQSLNLNPKNNLNRLKSIGNNYFSSSLQCAHNNTHI